MMRRIFLKTLIVLMLVSLAKIHSTNAYFTNVAASLGNTFTVGDWTTPESEAVDGLETYYNDDFGVDYTASDAIGVVTQVQLYYSFNSGDWKLLYADTPGMSPVSGTFTINLDDLEGDGEYGFLTIAIDNSGNIEDDADESGTLDPIELDTLLTDTFTTVDTLPPVTMLSVESYLAVVNEQFYNGGFESGNLDGWMVDSVGSDHQVTADDQKTGDYSALIGFRDAFPSAEPAYDSIKQNVSLPSAITSTLSFWYHLITNDLVSGGFFDAFVTSTGSDPLTVAHDGWDDPEVMEEDLGWKNVTYQLDGLEGKDIEVQFKVTQPYEDYQIWCYVDDVKLTAVTNAATLNTPLALSGNDGGGSNNLNITYTFDDNPPATYSGTPIIPGTSGEHTLKYFSTDEAGNIEPEKQITITATASAQVDFGVVLNEFLPNPSGDDDSPKPGGEWVRLYNNSSAAVDVAGWELNNANDGSLTISLANSDNNGNSLDGGETIIPASGTLTVYRNGDNDFTINDQTETIKLYHGSTLVDSYTYNFASGLPEGKSLKRDPNGTGAWKDPEVETAKETEKNDSDQEEKGTIQENGTIDIINEVTTKEIEETNGEEDERGETEESSEKKEQIIPENKTSEDKQEDETSKKDNSDRPKEEQIEDKLEEKQPEVKLEEPPLITENLGAPLSQPEVQAEVKNQEALKNNEEVNE